MTDRGDSAAAPPVGEGATVGPAAGGQQAAGASGAVTVSAVAAEPAAPAPSAVTLQAPPAAGSRPRGAGDVGAGVPRHGPAADDGSWVGFGWRLALAGLVAVVAVGVVLRFYTHANLWLDEALTVDISKLPVHDIPGALRRDGAPPLFYVLLHFWMKVFGGSDLGVRSLSGVLSILTLPFVWVAARRLGGRTAAVAATVLVASSPFAIYYGTEARMYALVGFLVAAGVVAVQRALERPRPGNLVAVTVCTAALLYSHYWSLYLVAATGLWLLWLAWRGPVAARRNARLLVGAVIVGGLTFIPWLPIFAYQARHTGTPWAVPADFAGMVNAISSFAGGATNQGRALGLLYFALAGLGFFGLARSRFTVELDLRGRPRSRALGWAFLATVVLAIVGGYISKSAFQARYAMVVFIPLMLLVALGFTTFADRRVRAVLLSASVVFGLVSSFPNIHDTRTQAGQVAAVLARLGRPGDVVAFCPDQLGPDVNRLLPPGRYQEITFPRDTGPAFVNWVDYGAAVRSASPVAFADRVLQMSAPSHQIWLVWQGGYKDYGTKCQQIETHLLADRQLGAHEMFAPSSRYYEPMELVHFVHLPG